MPVTFYGNWSFEVVGNVGELRLEGRLAALDETAAELAELLGVAQRAMLEDAFAAFEREVQAVEVGIAILEFVHHAQ